MGNVHLVTGYAGHQHVSSADQGSFNAALVGSGQYVLHNGNQFSASIISNNQIRVLDGDILMQGRHIRLNEKTWVDLTIENGQQGYYRNDLIVVRYSKNAETGVEDANLVVIRGRPAEKTPEDPAYIKGDIIGSGDILNDMPLYRVPLYGLTVNKLVPMFEVSDTTPEQLIEKLNNHTHTASDVGAIPVTMGKFSDLGVATLEEARTPGSYRIYFSTSTTHPTDWPEAFKDIPGGFGVLTVSKGDTYIEQKLTVMASNVEGFTRTATRILTANKESPWTQDSQIQIITYDGTGTVGADNPNFVTFKFVPKIVVIVPDAVYRQPTIFVHGIERVKGWGSANVCGGKLRATWDDNNKKLSWYADGTWSYDENPPDLSAAYQLNGDTTTYYAVAIG